MSSASLSSGRPSFFSENSTGIVVSVLMHAILLAVLMHHWVPEKEEKQVARPQFINAQLLQMKPAAAQPRQPKAVEAPKPQPKPEPKVDTEAIKRQEEQQRQQQAEQRRQEEQRQQEVKRQEEVKRQQEVKRQEEVKQQQIKREEEVKRQAAIKREEEAKQQQKIKEEAERKRQEEAKRQQEAKRQEELKRQQQAKADAERKRQEEIKRQQEQAKQQELAKQRELEQALAMEEEAMMAEETGAQVGTYVDYMASLIASNWSRPPGTRNGTQVLLQIRLGSAGRVVGVQVAKSSGNAAFDRSAEQAVWKVGQFTRLQEMDGALYQRDFRNINILFNPQDLRM